MLSVAVTVTAVAFVTVAISASATDSNPLRAFSWCGMDLLHDEGSR
jgi:hypothetical protein